MHTRQSEPVETWIMKRLALPLLRRHIVCPRNMEFCANSILDSYSSIPKAKRDLNAYFLCLFPNIACLQVRDHCMQSIGHKINLESDDFGLQFSVVSQRASSTMVRGRPAANSAMAARWSGGSITMGPAGRDRRVRARTGKRRTPGQRAEDSNKEGVELDLQDLEPEPASGSQQPARPLYTRKEQRSPDRKRGVGKNSCVVKNFAGRHFVCQPCRGC